MSDVALWERQPDETDLSFYGFTVYRDLEPHSPIPERRRNLENVKNIMGYTSLKMPSYWSTKYDWSKRVAAYDAYRDNKMLEVREARLADYAQRVQQMDTQAASLGYRVATKNLVMLQQRMENGEDVNPRDVKAALEAIKQASDIARRSAGLPNGYGQATGVESKPDDVVFYIGGDDD